jgi:ketosteroid isomerase-like protein
MTSIQLDRSTKYDWTEQVYSIVRNNNGRVTGKQLEREVGNKYEVRYAIARLTKEGRIRRIRGFGVDRVVFYYQVIDVPTLEP